ncbi:cadherin-6-like [Eucyclogobius newberryi]|uniref:cadherin-6-like n=1 Tax=Eucyclogobius newberryi TaxID=166745 RepID=UPI003B5A174D
MEQMRARSGREEAESGAEGAGPRRVRRKLREGVKVHYVDLDEEYPGPFPQFVTLLWWILDQEDGTVKYNLSGEGAGTIFDLDENNGKLYATRRLDREVKSIYILWANVVNKTTGLELIPESKVVIEIDDINDNEPIFSKEVYTGSVPERAERGTSVIQVTATDADYGKNATLVYSIRQGHPYFSVDLNTGVIRTALGPEHMDRVQREHYQVVIQAKDRPRLSGGLTGTTIVNITLTDVNNNPPLFNQSIYEFRVLESSKNGSVVGRVRAIDRDIGQNAEMFFTIVGGDGMDVFQISTDKETQEGIITVREPLDFERKQLYTVEIQVENTHVDQRFPLAGIKDNATVRISVEDVDEEPPQFDKAWYMMEVKEDAEVGTTVGAVSAVDPDGSRIPIKYAIDRRTDLDRVFDIHPGNGSIFLLSPIDREENAWHNISVIASEFNNPRQNSSVNVYIRVLDVNDNAPVLATTTETYVCEKSKAGQWIQTISAVDPDKPSSGHRFFFSLAPEGADRSNFTVRDNGDNTAAILTRRTSYSWLERSKYLVSVVITNADYPVQSSTSTLTVRVCTCDSHGNMELCNAKTLNISPGLSTGVLIFIPLCAVILLMIVFLFVALIMNKKRGSLNISKEDVWGNVANHNEEGGGEQDTLAFDMRVLRHPDSAPIRLEEPAEQRRDIVPTDTLFCKPPTPPYDSLMTYAYEGTGSVAESLSSLGSASSESDQDYQYLSEWGARFRKLSDLYGVEVADDQEL